MSNPEGSPIWYELMTDDPDAAQNFYGPIMGWTFGRMEGGLEIDYRIATNDGTGVCGVMRTPEHASGMPTMWFLYVGVDDVDASADKVVSLGGRVDIAPTDIPGVGRFAFVSDPQGAPFYLMRGNSDEDSQAFESNTPGHFSWNELVTTDQHAALEFYGKLFGWTKAGAMPMGDAGEYAFINCHDRMIGAVMTAPDATTRPYWNFALEVLDIDDAKSAVEAGGGTVRAGPMELPNDSGWLIQTNDPQGAKMMFSGPRRQG